MNKFGFTDVKIVTEIPKEMFKRPKLNRYSNDGGPSSAKEGVKRNDKEPFKPSFSRSSIPKQRFSSGKRRTSATYMFLLGFHIGWLNLFDLTYNITI